MVEGKTKKVEDLGEEVMLHFKDDITAGDGAKHDVLPGKGAICSEITARLMKYLEDKGVKTMFLEFLPPSTLRARKLKMFPLEVIVRFKKAGSFVRRYGGAEGESLPKPLVEFTYKSDALHDPILCVEHVEVLGIAEKSTVEMIGSLALSSAATLRDFFAEKDYELWDLKFEFGLDLAGEIRLGDEISPDTMRLRRAGHIYDKDIYRRDLGDPLEKYRVVLELCRDIAL